MAKNKENINVEIEVGHLDWLANIVEKFELPDESKALRILLDYAIEEADEEDIFDIENMRCRHCD
tara:strand:+ start:560 stop:754 length:195 start_codon:yes stop_codon:yes gene_type:complete